jgi:serine/threonine protein kinase
MKVINKAKIAEWDTYNKIILEKEILSEINHPFIVGIHYYFIDEFRIYFIMDHLEGGELLTHFNQKERFNEQEVKFFVS